MDFSNKLDQLKCSPSVKAGQALRWKRTLDVLLILLALPFLIPLALLVVLLIRSGSRGPVFSGRSALAIRAGASCVSSFGPCLWMPDRPRIRDTCIN